MILSCCRRAYSPRVKSPRRAGVAGGVGEGEVVPTGGVLEGDATLLSEDAGLKPRGIRLLLYGCISALDLLVDKCRSTAKFGCKELCKHPLCAGAFINVFVTCFPFLAHATVSSSSAPQFFSAVFPIAKLFAGPSPPHYGPPPTTTQAQDHIPNCHDRTNVHAKETLPSLQILFHKHSP